MGKWRQHRREGCRWSSDPRTPKARFGFPGFRLRRVILENQRFEPQERTDARWILRTDGGSVLDPKNAAVKTGSAQDQSRIVFRPFSVPWSAGGKNAGFVYYAQFPGGGVFSDDYELAITNLKSLDGLGQSATGAGASLSNTLRVRGEFARQRSADDAVGAKNGCVRRS
jgi:hypothetical protein